MSKIFISYKHYDKHLNNRDETVARKLYDKLQAAGFKCWMDKMNMPVVTDSWINNIVTAIKQCDLVIMIISEHAQNSVTIRRKELSVISKHQKLIIPFRIDQSELLPEFEWEISSCQWVDAWDDYESKIDEVISKLRSQLGDPHDAFKREDTSDKESHSSTNESKITRIVNNKSAALDYIKENGSLKDIPHLEFILENDTNQEIKNRAKRIIELITSKNKRVLHFDDEPFISKVLDKSLELQGWSVTSVSEVEDLFRELHNNQYDVLIMDIMSPIPPVKNEHVAFTLKEIDEMNMGMDTGIVLAKKIWQVERYKNVPVLFLSARYNPLYNTTLANNDKCRYLRKPILSSTVNEVLLELLIV